MFLKLTASSSRSVIRAASSPVLHVHARAHSSTSTSTAVSELFSVPVIPDHDRALPRGLISRSRLRKLRKAAQDVAVGATADPAPAATSLPAIPSKGRKKRAVARSAILQQRTDRESSDAPEEKECKAGKVEFSRQRPPHLDKGKSKRSARSAGGDAQGNQEGTESVNENDITDAMGAKGKSKGGSDTIPSRLVFDGQVSSAEIEVTEVKPLREMKVARLAHGLPKVLFSPGVHPFRDQRTGTWNFPPEFERIPTPPEFAFHRSPKYITPSQDTELLRLAEEGDCQFIGSTSTLTQALSQIYFALSGGQGVDLTTLSQNFAQERSDFTAGAELPASIILGPLGGGKYYIDSDKRWDAENILSEYGVILEKLLVSSTPDFKRFLTASPEEGVSAEERNEREAYRYQRVGRLLMRSQLDCHDPRLPGSGVFDIKTRACLPIRHDRANYVANSAYSITKDKGYKQSFEREYYDVIRAGMLKWSLQARIGMMDGIFVAYHNTERLFGFQYLPMSEIDERLFGSSAVGDQAFKLSLHLLEILMKACVDEVPGQALSVVVKRYKDEVTAFVEPQNGSSMPRQIKAITLHIESTQQPSRESEANSDSDSEMEAKGEVEFDTSVVHPSTGAPAPASASSWSIKYSLSKSTPDATSTAAALAKLQKAEKQMMAITAVTVPEGMTVQDMEALDDEKERKAEALASGAGAGGGVKATTKSRVKWKTPDGRIQNLRAEAKRSGIEWQKASQGWREGLYAWTEERA